MKRFFILSMLVMFTIVQVKAYDFHSLNNEGIRIYYEVLAGAGNRVMVVSSAGAIPSYSGLVNIPERVSYEGIEYVVEGIGSKAFEWCPELTEVILPPSLKTIRENAFYQCVKLKKINFPDAITSIRYYAFYNCTSLKTISLGANLTEIREYAFYQCNAVESVTFGNKVSLIDIGAFALCSKLKSVILPESLEEIGDDAFSTTGLSSITIPKSVKSIGRSAFSNCPDLEQVFIGDNVSFIGIFAFRTCYALKQFTVSEQNKNYSIHDGSLVNKDKTIFVAFPSGKTTVNFPASVKTIGEGAFGSCLLTEITLPNSVDSIGPEAFSDCSELENIIFPQNLKVIAHRAFQNDGALKNINIPDNVVSIGEYAFSYCTNVQEIVIGKNVTEIGNSAFNGIGWKMSLFNRNPVPQIVEDLGLNYYTITLFVPKGSVDLYKKANYWSIFYLITDDESLVANDDLINKNITIFNTNDGITVNSVKPVTVAVYTISGQMVYQKQMKDKLDIQLQRGFYIIKAGDVTQKMYVK